MMKIGILEAGAPPQPLADRYGSYSAMFRRLLGPAFKSEVFDVQAGAMPSLDAECDAYLITGSSCGVYDTDPWIGVLQDFVRQTAGITPMIGVCFGHQLMAQALGGQVVKSPKGWGLGLHSYDIAVKASWMDSANPVALPVSHQDQVIAIGPQGRLLGGNTFTPFGLIDYPSLKAMSVQAHPEFEPEFDIALIENRRSKFDHGVADAAIASLREPNDRQRVAIWLRRFLSAATRAVAPAA